MKKILSIISLAFALSFTANAQFLNTTEIVNSDCRIQFLNSNGIKIYELIGENLTWWKQSSGAIIIRDKVTQVTIPATYNGTPALSALDDSLDSWILSCKDCCSGGGDGGGCLESCTLADNVDINANGKYVDFNADDHQMSFNKFYDLVIGPIIFGQIILDGFHSQSIDGTVNSYVGNYKTVGEDTTFLPGEITFAGNPFMGSGSFLIGRTIVDTTSVRKVITVGNGTEGYIMEINSDGININPEPFLSAPMAYDVIHINNFTDSKEVKLRADGSITHNGAYANTSYVNYTGGDSDTIPDNTSLYIYNPAATVNGKQITLPANPFPGQTLNILAGGTITVGDVITSFTLDGNGRTIIGDVCPKLTINEMIELRYIDAGINTWYVISNCK